MADEQQTPGTNTPENAKPKTTKQPKPKTTTKTQPKSRSKQSSQTLDKAFDALEERAQREPEPDPRGVEMVRQLDGYLETGGQAYDRKVVRRFLDLTANAPASQQARIEEELLPIMDRVLTLLQVHNAATVRPHPMPYGTSADIPVQYSLDPQKVTFESRNIRRHPLTRLEDTLELCAPTDSRVILVQEEKRWWRCELIPPHAALSDLAEDHHRRKSWHVSPALAAARVLLPSR